jgi:hypothetical membrane protein
MTKEHNLKPSLYTGLLGVLILWVSISIAMYRAGLDLISNRPISYLGVYAPTKLLFSFALISSALLFMVFAIYIYRLYKVRNKYLAYFLIGLLGQCMTALIPDSSGSPRTVHVIAAFTLAFSQPLLMREFLLSLNNNAHRKLFLSLLRLDYLFFIVGIGLFIFVHGVAPLGEALPTVGFDIWVIVLTIITYKSNLLSASSKLEKLKA